MKHFIISAMLLASVGASAQEITTECAPSPYAGLYNISTRGIVGTQSEQLIAGFIIRGDQPMCVLVRARGLSLPDTIPNRLIDPQVRLVRQGGGGTIDRNDNWTDHPDADIIEGLFPGALAMDDAAIFTCLEPGGYTAVMSGVDGTTGTGIVEVFDVEFDTKIPQSCITEIIIREEIISPPPMCPVPPIPVDDDDDDDSSDDDRDDNGHGNDPGRCDPSNPGGGGPDC